MKKIVFLVCLINALAACKQTTNANTGATENTQRLPVITVTQADNAALIEAFNSKKSHLFIQGSGVVKKLLPDDNQGARHQKFLVTISTEQTLLFAHNVDLAQAVPLMAGDFLEFRGEYIYNPKGGVIHWTHHDPQVKILGGWIKHNGKTYQ